MFPEIDPGCPGRPELTDKLRVTLEPQGLTDITEIIPGSPGVARIDVDAEALSVHPVGNAQK